VDILTDDSLLRNYFKEISELIAFPEGHVNEVKVRQVFVCRAFGRKQIFCAMEIRDQPSAVSET